MGSAGLAFWRNGVWAEFCVPWHSWYWLLPAHYALLLRRNYDIPLSLKTKLYANQALPYGTVQFHYFKFRRDAFIIPILRVCLS
ncbi:hypothetical protein GQ44DRAFT_24155 [Phaeosphaeriaceae sp. PMI808]|nr:hypothetical protein GQ44DRAFT_24155 [Phaeosphaeriaceae sp. PMI808]